MPWKTDTSGKQYCPHCGAENKRKNALTCDECYRSPDEKPKQQQPATAGTPSIELLTKAIEEATKPSGERPYKKCPKCGAGANKGEIACRNCGAQLGHTIEEVIDASQGTIGVATFPSVQKYVTTGKTTLGNLTTGEPLSIPDTDRYAGSYVLGVQGVGKSSLLETLIAQDITKGYSVIVIDPHGDLLDHVIAQIPKEQEADILSRLYLLDIEDTAYPFGLNLFAIQENATTTMQQQTHDRALHVFEKCFPETSHMLLEKYIGNVAPVFFANASTGYSITDIPKFLRDDSFRNRLLAHKNVGYFIKSFWQEDYEDMSPSKRQTETASLATRLNRFVRSPIIGNIIGQSRNTIDFRRAIENREIILIKLPLKQLPQDAELIGTMLIAQIHAAIFSFADIPQEKRPGFSLFVDEFQHFATTDFSEMFTEGRKFGVRVTVAHQYRRQLPDYLESATMTARTKICLQCPEDSTKMAHIFMTQATATVRPEDIDPDPVGFLLTYGHDEPVVNRFLSQYLRPMNNYTQRMKVSYTFTDSTRPGGGSVRNLAKEDVLDLDQLSHFLYEVEKSGDWQCVIPRFIVIMFSSYAWQTAGFHPMYNWLFEEWNNNASQEQWLRSAEAVSSPQSLEKARSLLVSLPVPKKSRSGWLYSKHDVKNFPPQREAMLLFLSVFRAFMRYLGANPIGKKTMPSPADIAQTLVNLRPRTALVRTGETVATIITKNTPPRVAPAMVTERVARIKAATHQKYCKLASEVEQEIQKRLGLLSSEDAEKETTGSDVEAKIELTEQAVKQQGEKQSQPQTPESLDTMNSLFSQMRSRVIDPDTTILAALGEHYVLTIKQWMRLFEWGSYPRATQYFKELKENDLIYRKDREGRGGTLVEGDWFFLLTKGAHELTKRKQSFPLFRLEPNEAERTSGDTLFHTFLINEVLIHLRLLEREQPELVRIEQIDHERSMRRTYLAALQDSKLYPDGFLRLLVPTPNGLKRQYMFLELQHTTQRDEANWKAKCRKYLTLFEQETVLEKFFATKTPQVFVITINPEYVSHHKRWTVEILEEAREKGRAYGNRFIIGSFDTGISDMSMTPQQYFCDPRFFTPFSNAPRSLFGT